MHLPQIRRRWWDGGVSGSSHEVALLLLLLRVSLLLPPPRWRKKPPTQLLTNGGRVISWLLLPNLSVDIYLLLQPVGRKLGCEGSLGRSTALILSQEMTLTGTLSTEV